MNKLRLIFKLLFTRKRFILLMLDGKTMEVLTNVDVDVMASIIANYEMNTRARERFEA